jgi:titin
LPGKPGTPTFTDIKDTTVVLHWTPPEDDGGAEITNYIIHCRQENQVQWVQATKEKISKTEHKLVKLTKEAVYEFKVAAENKVGMGPFSDPSAPVKIKEVIGMLEAFISIWGRPSYPDG